MNRTLTASVIAATLVLGACGSGVELSTPASDAAAETASYQITFTNMSTGQLMTPPVAAIHDASVHLFEVGELASDAIRDIAETGAGAALVAFATDPANAELISAAGEIGGGPFGGGASVTGMLSSDRPDHVFSAVNMVICTNDAISGFDSISLPTNNEPLTLMAMAYDAGTRVNQNDNESFFPPPCRTGDVVEAPVEDPRQPIAQHAGQNGLTVPVQEGTPEDSNWDFESGAMLLRLEIVRN